MKKIEKSQITFLNRDRLLADAQDTYHWLRINDEVLAKDFLRRIEFVTKKFKEREKVEAGTWRYDLAKKEDEPEINTSSKGFWVVTFLLIVAIILLIFK